MDHNAHVLQNMAAEGTLDCKRAGCEGALPEPYYERDGVSLYHGDCRDVLATLPAESVSCCVTSPPFWGLRKYDCPPSIWGGDPSCSHTLDAQPMSDEGYAGRKRWQHDGVSRQDTPEAWSKHQIQGSTSQRKGRSNIEAQRNDELQHGATCSLCGAWRGWYGLEPTVAMYVEHTIEVLRAIRRVMRKDGVCWWDLDDSRGGSNKGIMADGSAVGGPKQQTVGGSIDGGLPKAGGIPKSLCLIPQRVALAASEDGWIVRSQIIIPSWMPESARDRPTDAYRVVLMLCRSRKYWYDAAAVRVAQSYQKPADVFGHNDGQRRDDGRAYEGNAPDGLRSLGNIWADIPPSAYPAAHFATFPVEEPERCIKASCPAEVCVRCGKARVRIVSVKKVLEDDKARAYMPEGPARLGAHRDALRRDGHRHDNPFQETHEEAGWTDCGCGAGFEPDDLEFIETPTGERTGDDPSFVTGRAGYNRPRGPNEGSRPITRYEQRRYAGQLRDSPNRADMEAEAGPAFAHYLRTDKSGARPIPPELLEAWVERGWLEPVAVPAAPASQYEPGLVLDPFVGTGTTCVAAVKLGRRAIGIDASEEYLKQAVTRLTVGDAGVRRIVAAERAGAKQEVLL